MVCDSCFENIPLINYVEEKVVKAEEDVIISGRMPSEAVGVFEEIEKETAFEIAKSYKNNIEEKDIVKALDLKVLWNEEKYQPEVINDKLTVKLSNLNIDAEKTYAMMHIKDDGSFETLPVNVLSNTELEFKTKSFSTYILITVDTFTVTFSGDGNYKILDENGEELTDGANIADGTNFNFMVVPNDGYGIVDIVCNYSSGDSAIETFGYVKGKNINIANVSENLTVEVTTALAPKVTTHPESIVKVEQSGTATFTVTAENATTYYWEYRENKNTYWKAAGSTSATLSLTTMAQQSGYEYRCLVGNDYFTEHERVSSDSAYLIVCQDEIVVGETPIIMVQPTMDNSKVLVQSGKASYFVTAMGTNLTFTWQYRENEEDYWKSITSSIGSSSTATASESTDEKPMQISTFTTATALYSMAGYQYRCLVGNNFYKEHDAVKSDIIAISVADDEITEQVKYLKLDVTKQPESQKVKIGNTATFAIETSGVNTYKWQYQPSGDIWWYNVDSTIGSGYATKTLTVNTTSMSVDENLNLSGDLSGALFRCVVSNSSVADYTRNSDVAVLSIAQDEVSLENIKVKPNVNNDSVTVEIEEEAREYNGEQHTPTIVVKDGETTLTEGTDYTVSYGKNIYPEKGTIIISGSGDYGGTRTEEFDIAKRSLTIKVKDASKKYDGDALTSNEYEITKGSLPSGDKLEIKTSGSITEIGTTENVIESVIIKNKNDEDVTNCYEITTESGTLEITPFKEVGYIKLEETEGSVLYGTFTKEIEVTDLQGGEITVEELTDTKAEVSVNGNKIIIIYNLEQVPAETEIKIRITASESEEYSSSYVDYTLKVSKNLAITYYENNEIYDGNWTNQNVVAVVTPLSKDTTWISVKAGKSDWTTTPSYAEIAASGDNYTVTFNKSISGDVYIREVNESGKATTYASEAQIIKIDKEAPIINEITTKTIEKVLKIKAKVEDSGSSIKYYAVSRTTPTTWNEYNEALGYVEEDLLNSGTYYLWVKDEAGNETKSEEIIAIKDITPPTGRIDIQATNIVDGEKHTNKETVVINIEADDNQTQTKDIMYAIYSEEDYAKVKEGTKEIEWKAYTNQTTFDINEGKNVIYVIFKDIAGNVSTVIENINL